MNYISVMAATEDLARAEAAEKTGYHLATIGALVHVVNHHENSRQYAHIFETSHDVTKHPLYVRAKLHDAFRLGARQLEDGHLLSFGPAITAGG